LLSWMFGHEKFRTKRNFASEIVRCRLAHHRFGVVLTLQDHAPRHDHQTTLDPQSRVPLRISVQAADSIG
jgi:hypothetical protein